MAAEWFDWLRHLHCISCRLQQEENLQSGAGRDQVGGQVSSKVHWIYFWWLRLELHWPYDQTVLHTHTHTKKTWNRAIMLIVCIALTLMCLRFTGLKSKFSIHAYTHKPTCKDFFQTNEQVVFPATLIDWNYLNKPYLASIETKVNTSI